MNLSGSQKKAFQQALLSAFPDRQALRQMVSFELEENLAAIAGSRRLRDVIFNLIEWANSRGRMEDLLRAVQKENPTNPDLAAFIESLKRQKRIANLSTQVQNAHTEARWEEVASFGREIQELDPGFKDVPEQTK